MYACSFLSTLNARQSWRRRLMDTNNGFITGSATMPSFLRFATTPFGGTLTGPATTANAYVCDSCTPVCLAQPVILRTALTPSPAAGHTCACRCAPSKIRLLVQGRRCRSVSCRGYGARRPMGRPRHAMVIPSARSLRQSRNAPRTARTRDWMCRLSSRALR